MIIPQALAPKKHNQPRNEVLCSESLKTLRNSLDIIENYFLKDKKFIGGEEISIADLEFIGEVTQYWIAGCNIYKGRPNMERWMEECQKVLSPHFEPVLQKVRELQKAGTYHYFIDVGQAK